MQKLILVRYGSYHNEHISEEGRDEMEKLAQRLSNLLKGKRTAIIAANIDRAQESAKMLIAHLGLNERLDTFNELYAAEEEERSSDLERASHLLLSYGADFDFLIAVVSREYIEQLPSYFIAHVLNLTKDPPAISLERGEAVIIDCSEGFTSILR